MSEVVYVLKVVEGKPNRGNPGSTIITVQNGPVREKKEGVNKQFVGKIMIRVPAGLAQIKNPETDEKQPIKPGQFLMVETRIQGLSDDKSGREYLSCEVVATSVKPLPTWMMGGPEALYPLEPIEN